MQIDLPIREPAPGEITRVLYLLRNIKLRADARLLVAVKSRPIERFVAAAAWWAEGPIARFHLACQPGADRDGVCGPLIEGIVKQAKAVKLESVHYADLLSDDSEWLPALRAHGFKHFRSERFFEVNYADAWNRVMELYNKNQSRIPASWRTDCARNHSADTVLGFISPHRLVPPAEVREYWRADSAGGFELDYSRIVFDRDRPFGTILLRRLGSVLFVDVLVVEEANRLLRALAELSLFHSGLSRLPVEGPIRALQFRSGEREHRQTGNLALRMGGRELACHHVFARNLNTCDG